MQSYNLYVKGYELLRNRKYIPMRFFSPFRYIWRLVASKSLPKILEKESKISSVTASHFLKKNGIEKKLIISFTSFPKRIKNVWQVVECLMRQTIVPDEIILYLSKDQFLTIEDVPKELTSRINNVFKIQLVNDDLKSYKKMYYSFQDYPDDLVLLVDDDIYYPIDLVESMLKAYLVNKDSVICRFGYKITYNQDNSLVPYEKWPLFQGASDSQNILFGTGGGSLYEPNKMYVDTCNKDLFSKLCPIADDIWINAMTRLANLRIVKLDCGGLLPIHNDNNTGLYIQNVLNGKNDIQIKAIDEYYSNNLNRQIFSHK